MVHGRGDCSEFDLCSTHGACVSGLCVCDLGFLGMKCDIEVKCQFWDVALSAWSDEGCEKVAPPSGPDGFLHCDCTHLTDFGGIAIPMSAADLLAQATSIEFATFSLDDMMSAISGFDFASNPAIYIVIFTVSFLNLVTLIFAHFRLHRRMLWMARDKRLARHKGRERARQVQVKKLAEKQAILDAKRGKTKKAKAEQEDAALPVVGVPVPGASAEAEEPAAAAEAAEPAAAPADEAEAEAADTTLAIAPNEAVINPKALQTRVSLHWAEAEPFTDPFVKPPSSIREAALATPKSAAPSSPLFGAPAAEDPSGGSACLARYRSLSRDHLPRIETTPSMSAAARARKMRDRVALQERALSAVAQPSCALVPAGSGGPSRPAAGALQDRVPMLKDDDAPPLPAPPNMPAAVGSSTSTGLQDRVPMISDVVKANPAAMARARAAAHLRERVKALEDAQSVASSSASVHSARPDRIRMVVEDAQASVHSARQDRIRMVAEDAQATSIALERARCARQAALAQAARAAIRQDRLARPANPARRSQQQGPSACSLSGAEAVKKRNVAAQRAHSARMIDARRATKGGVAKPAWDRSSGMASPPPSPPSPEAVATPSGGCQDRIGMALPGPAMATTPASERNSLRTPLERAASRRRRNSASEPGAGIAAAKAAAKAAASAAAPSTAAKAAAPKAASPATGGNKLAGLLAVNAKAGGGGGGSDTTQPPASEGAKPVMGAAWRCGAASVSAGKGLGSLVAAAKAQEEALASLEGRRAVQRLKQKLRESKVGVAADGVKSFATTHVTAANATRRKVAGLAAKGQFKEIGAMGGRAVKRQLGGFFSRFWNSLRSEHTIASFIWPHAEETDVVTDPQVVQIFWNGVMTELFITAFLGENDGDSIIQMIILALIGGGMLAGMVMLNRIVFRWGNRGRRFMRSKRELKGATKKKGEDGKLQVRPRRTRACSTHHRHPSSHPLTSSPTRPPRQAKDGKLDARTSLGRRVLAAAIPGRRGGKSKLSRTAWRRQCINTTRWALAWLFNWTVYFVMTWFCPGVHTMPHQHGARAPHSVFSPWDTQWHEARRLGLLQSRVRGVD